jgi:hypothetical protein
MLQQLLAVTCFSLYCSPDRYNRYIAHGVLCVIMDSGRVVKTVAADIKKLCGSNRSSYTAEINFLLRRQISVGARTHTHTHTTFLNAATCSIIECQECIWQATQQPTPK